MSRTNDLLRFDSTATEVIASIIISNINKEEAVRHYLTSRAAAPVVISVLCFNLGLSVIFQNFTLKSLQ